MELREKLCSLRKERSISQSEIAERLEVSRQTVSRWETGTSVPTTENLMRLSTLYGVPLDELMENNWIPPRPKEQEVPEPTVLEPPKLRYGKRLLSALAAVLLISAFAFGILFAQQKDSNVISTADLEGEVIDQTTLGESIIGFPPTE